MPVSITLPTVNGDNGTWGTTLNAAINQVNGYDVFAVKSADETVTSNTTLQDDDHLTGLALGVGTWLVQAGFIVSGAAAGDVKVAWAFSGTTTAATRSGQGPASVSTDALGATAQGFRSAAAGGTAATITASTPYGTDGTNLSAISEFGVLVVSVAGSLKVQWAQNASSATGTVMRAGSWLHARRVA